MSHKVPYPKLNKTKTCRRQNSIQYQAFYSPQFFQMWPTTPKFCQQGIHLKIVPWDSREVATMLIVDPKARVKQAENEKSSFQQAVSLGNYCSAQTTSPFCLVADFKSNKVNVGGKEDSPVINLSPQESTQPSRKVQLLNVLTPQNEGIQRSRPRSR